MYFEKLAKASETKEGLGEMFEGDSADTCGEQFLLMLMRGGGKWRV